MRTLSLFEEQRLTLKDAIELTAQNLRTYGENYDRWGISFSGGKDSSALVTLIIYLIKTGRIPKPKNLTVFYADTRLELPPLQISAMQILEKIRAEGFETKVVTADLDKRFLTYILGRGVTPPSNTMRWCTSKIKVEPMVNAWKDFTNEPTLMLTGVRIGESAVRDQRIAISCSKDGGECGQGWFQSQTAPSIDTLAPILHWRVCQVWDWLMFEAPTLGFPTEILAEAYGGDEATEINARTGCMGCPIANTKQDTNLDRLVKSEQWAYLKPLQQLSSIFFEMRNFGNRLQQDGTETKKDGSLVSNPGRKEPLTIAARLKFFKQILDIQAQVNQEAERFGKPKIDILNQEEQARIWELITAKRQFPEGWHGLEPRGDVLLPHVYPDGSKQLLLW